MSLLHAATSLCASCLMAVAAIVVVAVVSPG